MGRGNGDGGGKEDGEDEDGEDDVDANRGCGVFASFVDVGGSRSGGGDCGGAVVHVHRLDGGAVQGQVGYGAPIWSGCQERLPRVAQGTRVEAAGGSIIARSPAPAAPRANW